MRRLGTGVTLKTDLNEAETALERRGRWKKEDSLAAPGEKKEDDKEETARSTKKDTTLTDSTCN